MMFTFFNAFAAQGGGLNELQIAFVCKETLSVSSQVYSHSYELTMSVFVDGRDWIIFTRETRCTGTLRQVRR